MIPESIVLIYIYIYIYIYICYSKKGNRSHYIVRKIAKKNNLLFLKIAIYQAY